MFPFLFGRSRETLFQGSSFGSHPSAPVKFSGVEEIRLRTFVEFHGGNWVNDLTKTVPTTAVTFVLVLQDESNSEVLSLQESHHIRKKIPGSYIVFSSYVNDVKICFQEKRPLPKIWNYVTYQTSRFVDQFRKKFYVCKEFHKEKQGAKMSYYELLSSKICQLGGIIVEDLKELGENDYIISRFEHDHHHRDFLVMKTPTRKTIFRPENPVLRKSTKARSRSFMWVEDCSIGRKYIPSSSLDPLRHLPLKGFLGVLNDHRFDVVLSSERERVDVKNYIICLGGTVPKTNTNDVDFIIVEDGEENIPKEVGRKTRVVKKKWILELAMSWTYSDPGKFEIITPRPQVDPPPVNVPQDVASPTKNEKKKKKRRRSIQLNEDDLVSLFPSGNTRLSLSELRKELFGQKNNEESEEDEISEEERKKIQMERFNKRNRNRAESPDLGETVPRLPQASKKVVAPPRKLMPSKKTDVAPSRPRKRKRASSEEKKKKGKSPKKKKTGRGGKKGGRPRKKKLSQAEKKELSSDEDTSSSSSSSSSSEESESSSEESESEEEEEQVKPPKKKRKVVRIASSAMRKNEGEREKSPGSKNDPIVL